MRVTRSAKPLNSLERFFYDEMNILGLIAGTKVIHDI
jgi:hypothetical protein